MENRSETSAGKTEWTKPELVDLDLEMGDVLNGVGFGSDGAGGANTSAS